MFDMKWASSKLLFTTARLRCERVDGSESLGTAFFFRFDLSDRPAVTVLVTNRHVVAGAVCGEFRLHRAMRTVEGFHSSGHQTLIRLDRFEQRWVAHPGAYDLCAMPVDALLQELTEQHKPAYVGCVPEDRIPGGNDLQLLPAIQDVTMVGYPIGLWDERNNLPVVRRGITASHPAADFNGESLGLVDLACFPGSSGSPVLVLNEGHYSEKNAVVVGTRAMLLGVLFATPRYTPNGTVHPVEIPTTSKPSGTAAMASHLGFYVKARELLELKRVLTTED